MQERTPTAHEAVRFTTLSAGGPNRPLGERSHGLLIFPSSSPARIGLHTAEHVAPRAGAAWLPPNTPHRIEASDPILIAELRGAAATGLPSELRVFLIPSLLAHLTRHLAGSEKNVWSDERRKATVTVFLEEVRDVLNRPPLRLPSDARLAKIAQGLLADPADPRELDQWGKRVGVSSRHISRRFLLETGLGFSDWRSHLRAHIAQDMLLANDTLSIVAHRLGYASEGAFIRMFKRVTGKTPGEFLADRR